MQQFTDMHGRPISDGMEVYFNGQFPAQIPAKKRIRDGIAIIEDNKLVFAANIKNKLQSIGLYWELDGEPCYDLIIVEEVEIFEPTIIKYRGITAEISICNQGYNCVVTDRHGNSLDWFIRADNTNDAINRATLHFDNAIRCLRGFITSIEFAKIVA